MSPSARLAPALAVLLVVAAFPTASRGAPAIADATLEIDCRRNTEDCPLITIANDPPSSTRTFTGFADPSMTADPADPSRIWMLHSYLEGQVATGARGGQVGVPVVATHLARSGDGGATWEREAVMWRSSLADDPEGRGPPSYFGSESVSLAATHDEAGTTWYSVRLAYFLEPVTAYRPRFGTGWTMRVAAANATSPAALAQAPEAILGTRMTASVYGVHARLDTLSPEVRACAIWNNPAIAVVDGLLYVMPECLEIVRGDVDDATRRIVVFRTRPDGPPASWQWEYAGVLAGVPLATELGGLWLVSANISRAADGSLLMIVTPVGGAAKVGQGCAGIELASIDPPRVRRDEAGRAVVRARQTAAASSDWHTGACTHDAASSTGLVTVAATTAGSRLRAELRASGLRP